MQKDSVSGSLDGASEGSEGVFDVSTGVVAAKVPLSEQKPLLDQIPLMRPEVLRNE